MRYLMTFSYDGNNYGGYQRQNGQETIEEEIEEKLSKLNSNKKIKIYASGRTDAKVHAYNQKAHFDTDKIIDDKFKYSLNSILNKDIYVKSIEKVDDDFHARYSVKEKQYIYKLNVGAYNPFDRNYIYQYNKKLDIDKMKIASSYLLGKHNFKSFSGPCEKESYEREIYSIDININEDIITFKFSGNGFLRYMVRNIVGTLIEVGSGKRNENSMIDILEKENRSNAGVIAPPEGLYLYDVKYGK